MQSPQRMMYIYIYIYIYICIYIYNIILHTYILATAIDNRIRGGKEKSKDAECVADSFCPLLVGQQIRPTIQTNQSVQSLPKIRPKDQHTSQPCVEGWLS